MRTKSLLVAILTLAAFAPAPAAAQLEREPGPFVTVLGGGISVPLGDAADVLPLGGGLQLGFGWYLSPAFAARLEYQYSGWSIGEEEIGVEGIDGIYSAHTLDLDASYDFFQEQLFGLYAIGGPSLVYRRATLSETTGQVTLLPFCQPTFLLCVPQAAPATEEVASASDWNFGFNVGGGARFRLDPAIEIFAEARYRYAFGDTVRDAQGRERDTDTAWLPIFAGLRIRGF